MGGNRLPFFLMGLGLGAAVGLLTAPKRGREMREDLRRGAEEGSDFMARSPSELVKTVTDGIREGNDAVAAQRARLESALDAGVEAYRSAAGEH